MCIFICIESIVNNERLRAYIHIVWNIHVIVGVTLSRREDKTIKFKKTSSLRAYTQVIDWECFDFWTVFKYHAVVAY